MSEKSTDGERGTIEIYTPERKAEFLLTNAVSREGYRQAQAEIRRMGLDASKIRHRKPRRR